ncbi:MAG: GntR family transcriptional regulator [Chloroflexota bacterium]
MDDPPRTFDEPSPSLPREVVQRFEPRWSRHEALWVHVADALRRGIILGELPPGLHLQEPALAEKFGVSRIPIREALARLALEGLVEIHPRRGAYVVGVTEMDVHYVYDLRILLETRALESAIERVSPRLIADLNVLVDQMAAAIQRRDLRGMADEDIRFHHAILSLADNPRLLTAWEPIAGLAGAMIETNLAVQSPTSDLHAAVEAHRELIRLIERGDLDAAKAALRTHLENGEQSLRESMRPVESKTRRERA